jgi:hypothetical protein
LAIVLIVIGFAPHVGSQSEIQEIKDPQNLGTTTREEVLLVPSPLVHQTYSIDPIVSVESEVNRLAIKYQVSASLVNKIIKCESSLYKSAVNENLNSKGEVWSRDYGPLQINDYYHAGRMQAMGLNIYKWEDSLEYGVKLLAEQGTSPWKASEHCWSR